MTTLTVPLSVTTPDVASPFSFEETEALRTLPGYYLRGSAVSVATMYCALRALYRWLSTQPELPDAVAFPAVTGPLPSDGATGRTVPLTTLHATVTYYGWRLSLPGAR